MEPLKFWGPGSTRSDLGRAKPPGGARANPSVASGRRPGQTPSPPPTPVLILRRRSPPRPRSPCLFQENFPGRLALSMLGGGAGLGSGSCRNSTAPAATLGSRGRARRWAGRSPRGTPPGCWPGASWPPPWHGPLGPGPEAGSTRAQEPPGVPSARRRPRIPSRSAGRSLRAPRR